MKIVVIQEEIIQTDITPKELTKRWKKLEQLPGIDEVVIEVPAHYPNIEQLHTYIGDADAVFGLWIGPDNMNEAFLSQHPNLKYVATLGHGWEKFDTDMTRKRRISISNTIYGSQTIAEYAFALLMDVCHHIGTHDTRIKTIDWSVPENHNEFCKSVTRQIELYDKTIGVIGLGAIGAKVANIAVRLGMEVYGYDPFVSVDAAWGLSKYIKHITNVEDIYKECDYITIHVPALPATKGMLNADAFAMMKDGVRILNFARDVLVNDEDIKAALASGKVAKYVTDFPNPAIAGTENVIALPHLGASTEESEDNCAIMACKEIKDFMENGNIKNSVNYPNVNMGVCGDTARVTICHKNIPNMLTQFTGVFAKQGGNVSGMISQAKGEYAYSILDIDKVPTEDDINALLAIDGVIKVRAI